MWSFRIRLSANEQRCFYNKYIFFLHKNIIFKSVYTEEWNKKKMKKNQFAVVFGAHVF